MNTPAQQEGVRTAENFCLRPKVIPPSADDRRRLPPPPRGPARPMPMSPSVHGREGMIYSLFLTENESRGTLKQPLFVPDIPFSHDAQEKLCA